MKLFEKKEEKNKCKGLFFRGTVSSYVSSHNSIEVRKSLRILKRKSCPGCETCGWVLDFFKEDICDGGYEDYIGKIEDGKMYTYKILSSPAYCDGWYEGYDEIDGVEFVEVKE